jgi:hypothetical protein
MKPINHYGLLVALAGCSGSAEKESASLVQDSVSFAASRLEVEPVAPVALRAINAGWRGPTDTLPWADTAQRGDTTFFNRGRVITSTVVLTDSQWIRLSLPAALTGVPAGLFSVWDGTALKPNAELFTLTYGGESPATLLARLDVARSRGIRMVTSMTGGARANYLTAGAFDMEKWKARMKAYDTPEIRAAVARAVSEGTLLANSVMDEPFNLGNPGNEANGWGPAGTMSKARVDSMCGYARAIFPMLPQGVFHDYTMEPEGSYRVCDFLTTQYRVVKGTLAEYRDGALMLCRRDHHACSFGINVLDGGIPARRAPGKTDYAPGDCPLTTTGGRGTYFPNCRMTPAQVRDAGMVLGPAGCFLTGFRYDSAFMAKPENQQAFMEVIAVLSALPPTSCIRR